MRIKNLNNTAFTLLEVLLSSLIFIVSIAGVFVVLNNMRYPVINKENALTAAVFGKQVLETLRSQVRADGSGNYYGTCSGGICTDFSLALGTHQVPSTSLPSGLSWPTTALSDVNVCNAVSGCLVYNVSCGDNSSNINCGPDVARRVDLGINWPSLP